jgi:hypothetical protein
MLPHTGVTFKTCYSQHGTVRVVSSHRVIANSPSQRQEAESMPEGQPRASGRSQEVVVIDRRSPIEEVAYVDSV